MHALREREQVSLSVGTNTSGIWGADKRVPGFLSFEDGKN